MIKKIILMILLISISLLASAKLTTIKLEKLLYKHQIKCSNIVMKIAILESNWFKSNLAIRDNNIFGFKTGKTKFKSYDEAVYNYKIRVDNRYGLLETYYQFLTRIGYAEDPKYISKLKNITYDYTLHRMPSLWT